MVNINKIKNFVYYYRYNILFPGTIGGLILYDYLNLKKKRRLVEEQAQRKAQKEAAKSQ